MLDDAKKRANAIAPQPDETPSGAAAHGAVIAFMVGVGFYVLLPIVSFVTAWLLIIALAAVFAFLDCRLKWKRNSEEVSRAIDYLQFMKEHQPGARSANVDADEPR